MKTKTLPKPFAPALKWTIKFLLVIGFLGFLIKKGFISIEATQKALGHPEMIFPALGVSVLAAILGAVRWQILLRAQAIHLSIGRVFQLAFVGTFFNVVIPGAVSGDLVKALYIGKEMPGMRAAAFGSILFDRILGVCALVMVSAMGVALGYARLEGTPLLTGVQVLVTTSAAFVFGFFVYLFMVTDRFDPLLRFLKTLSQRFEKAGSILRIYEGVRFYHHRKGAVFWAIAISLLIHLMIGWTCLQYALALGEDHLFLLGLYVVVPLGLLVTAVPVAPAGMGTGHAAFLYLFKLIGSERGADVFSLVALSSLLIGCIGAVVYLQFRSKNPNLDPALVSQAP